MPDENTTGTDFAAIWSSDGVTRSFAPSATGVPVDLPFLFSGGQSFGPYRIIRPIGKGGMGQVYEAEETESGRRVALKLLSRGLGDDEERERFLREGQLAASLSHPNCVYVFGTSEIQGFPVIAMELVPEGTLKDRVVPDSPMTAAVAVDAVLQVITGLEAAASIGILHRDIKPSNCFVHREGRVLVGDFGLSVASSGHGSGGTGTILGTPGFASPEQLRGDDLDIRSDIYSVGATLFYLLAGRAPFEDHSTTGLIEKVASSPPPSLILIRPELPRRLSLAIARCLAKTPGERFASYAALREALEPFGSARLAPAPLVRRLLAGWVDGYITGLPAMLLIPWLGLFPLSVSHRGDALIVSLVSIVAMSLYYGLLEGHWGAGIGKSLAGLRVVDGGQGTPGIRHAVERALAFGVPSQAIVYTMVWLVVRKVPDVSTSWLNPVIGTACLAVLFCMARPSNGWQGLHDRLTRTSVVRRRVRLEARDRVYRERTEERAPFTGGIPVGPYVISPDVVAPVAAATCVVGFDDRLKRRVWIELLPAGTPPLNALRRDLDRPTRARWLGGRRSQTESWDAYEAIDGEPLPDLPPTGQRWARVRHWLADLTREITAGLNDGSLPPLDPACVWIGRDDHARILEWSRPGTGAPRSDAEATPAGLPSAQRLLYVTAVSALLGVPVAGAGELPPRTPLPLPARKTLLALRNATYATPEALRDGVASALATPAILARSRRALQIAASAALPIVLVVVTIGGILAFGRGASGDSASPKAESAQSVRRADDGSVRVNISDPTKLERLSTARGLWTTGLAVGAGTFIVSIVLSVLGALITGSGFTFRPFGAVLVNRHGEPVSRIRALWRSTVTWSLVFVLLGSLKFTPKDANASVSLLLVQTTIVAAMLAAALWAIARPTRGVQDRLAGTWIVPR